MLVMDRIQDPGSEIRDPGSEIWDPRSGIRDPGSEIRNPEKTYPGYGGQKSTGSRIHNTEKYTPLSPLTTLVRILSTEEKPFF